jgi:uncharacterized protein (TIGR02265 family)
LVARCKGTNLIYLRKLLQDRGPEAEAAFRQWFPLQEQEVFRSAMPVSWVPVELMARYFQAAAEVAFPGDPLGLRKVGAGIARDNLNGVYKILLRVVSVPVLIQQSAKIWSVYQEKGLPSVQRDGDHAGSFMVTDFPDLPPAFREQIAGYLEALLEMSGARDPRVKVDERDPQAWTWRISWS